MNNFIDPNVINQHLSVQFISVPSVSSDGDGSRVIALAQLSLLSVLGAEERDRWLDDGGALTPED
jgi:hypothetical protein